MRQSLRRLVDLHQLDEKLLGLADQLATVPGERAATDQQESEAKLRVEEARARVEQLAHEQREAEAALQDQETTRARLEGQQHQVRSNEAYTALLHEIEAAGDAISRHETRILELMEATEEARATLESAEAEARRLEEEIAERRRSLDAREEELTRERARIAEERAKLAGGLEKELLTRYERIAARRRPAVAVVSKEICMGCRVGIPPQLFVELIEAESLVTCNSCQRILIHERVLEP